MKAYGIPRVYILENPDVGDIQCSGRKSSIGKLPSKSGEFKSYIRNKERKANIRRYFKRLARVHNKKLCSEDVEWTDSTE
jgi:hypothetical protein